MCRQELSVGQDGSDGAVRSDRAVSPDEDDAFRDLWHGGERGGENQHGSLVVGDQLDDPGAIPSVDGAERLVEQQYVRLEREAAYGMRLDIPAGTAVRFEPGREQDVDLVAYGGDRVLRGMGGLVDGDLDDEAVREAALERARERGYTEAEE